MTDDDGKDAIFRRMEAVERRRLLADLRAQVVAAREQFMRVTRTPADHPMARQYDEFLALIDGGSDE